MANNILPGTWHKGNTEFWFKAVQVPINGVAIDTSGALYSLSVPASSLAVGVINAGLPQSAQSFAISMNTPTSDYQTAVPFQAEADFRGLVGAYYGVADADTTATYFRVRTDSDGKVKMRKDGAAYYNANNYTTVQIWGYEMDLGAYDYP